MTNALRWIAVVPAALVSFVALFMLLASLRGLLLRFCPDGDLGTEWNLGSIAAQPSSEHANLLCGMVS